MMDKSASPQAHATFLLKLLEVLSCPPNPYVYNAIVMIMHHYLRLRLISYMGYSFIYIVLLLINTIFFLNQLCF